jgi:hypothetical protein
MRHNLPLPWKRLEIELALPPLYRLSAAECRHCQEALPLFISDELAGLAVDELYRETAVHLDICPFCLAEYEELSRLATAAFYSSKQ